MDELTKMLMGALETAAGRIGGFLGGIGEGAFTLMGNVADAGRNVLFGGGQVAMGKDVAPDSNIHSSRESNERGAELAVSVQEPARSVDNVLSPQAAQEAAALFKPYVGMQRESNGVISIAAAEVQVPNVGSGAVAAQAKSAGGGPAIGGQVSKGGFSQSVPDSYTA